MTEDLIDCDLLYSVHNRLKKFVPAKTRGTEGRTNICGTLAGETDSVCLGEYLDYDVHWDEGKVATDLRRTSQYPRNRKIQCTPTRSLWEALSPDYLLKTLQTKTRYLSPSETLLHTTWSIPRSGWDDDRELLYHIFGFTFSSDWYTNNFFLLLENILNTRSSSNRSIKIRFFSGGWIVLVSSKIYALCSINFIKIMILGVSMQNLK